MRQDLDRSARRAVRRVGGKCGRCIPDGLSPAIRNGRHGVPQHLSFFVHSSAPARRPIILEDEAAASDRSFGFRQLARVDGFDPQATSAKARSRPWKGGRKNDPIAQPDRIRRGRLAWIDLDQLEPRERGRVRPPRIQQQCAVADGRHRRLEVEAVPDADLAQGIPERRQQRPQLRGGSGVGP